MSKNTHPVSFRLGLSQIWKTNLNTYNSKFTLYIDLMSQKKFLAIYLKETFLKAECLGNIIEIAVYPTKWTLTVCYHCINNNNLSNKKLFTTNFFFTYIYWMKECFKIKFFNNQNITNVAFLIANYIKYSYKSNQIDFKTIISFLSMKFLNNFQQRRIYKNAYGIKYSQVKGLKIYCKGRLGSIRNPLTQVYKKSIGSTSKVKLKNFIDHSCINFTTKRGSYGIQVWIFYF